MSGLGGIVLFRRTFTKVVNQPRLVAGVVAALCVKTRSGVGVPINTIELETFTVTVVELALNDNAENNESEFLRAVLFHDTSDVSPLFVAVVVVRLHHFHLGAILTSLLFLSLN